MSARADHGDGPRRAPRPASQASAVAARADLALQRVNRHRLLMGVFISSESLFFLSLILAYVLFHGAGGTEARDVLDVPRTALFSLALFASSGSIVLAERGLQARQAKRLRLWLLVTIALGGLFVLGQTLEYRHLIGQGITISRNLFGTTFFTLTGFHGLHVLIGLLALLVVAGLAFAGDFDDGNETALGAVALYWHFVDGVWVVVFSLVYLWTLL